MLNRKLLDLLVCPICKDPFFLLSKKDGLHCKKCKLVFPIQNDIPILIIEKAIAEHVWLGSPIKL